MSLPLTGCDAPVDSGADESAATSKSAVSTERKPEFGVKNIGIDKPLDYFLNNQDYDCYKRKAGLTLCRAAKQNSSFTTYANIYLKRIDILFIDELIAGFFIEIDSFLSTEQKVCHYMGGSNARVLDNRSCERRFEDAISYKFGGPESVNRDINWSDRLTEWSYGPLSIFYDPPKDHAAAAFFALKGFGGEEAHILHTKRFAEAEQRFVDYENTQARKQQELMNQKQEEERLKREQELNDL